MKMRHTLFIMTLEKMEVDFEYRDEFVGVRAERYGFTISFYSRIEDGHKLVVDEFGRGRGKDWVGYEPTPAQIEMMEYILGSELRALRSRLEEEEEREREAEQSRKDWEETMASLYQTER